MNNNGITNSHGREHPSSNVKMPPIGNKQQQQTNEQVSAENVTDTSRNCEIEGEALTT